MSRGQDIRAGGAFVEMYVKGIGEAGRQVMQFGQRMAQVGAGITAIGAAMTAPLIAASRAFAAAGDNLNKMAPRAGMAVEALSEIGYAAELSGSSLDVFGNAMFRARRRLDRAVEGAGPAAAAFEKMNLNAEEFKNLSVEEQFYATVDGLNGIANESSRAQAAFEIFGNSGKSLLPLINAGTEGIEQMRKEARQLGIVMSTEDAAAAARLTDSMHRLNRVQDAVWKTMGAAVAGPLADVYDLVVPLAARFNHLVNANRDLFRHILMVGAAISGVGLAITALGATIMFAGGTMLAFSAILGGIGTVIATVLSPFGLLIAAIAGGVTYLVQFTEAGKNMQTAVGGYFSELATSVVQSIGAITTAVGGGDIDGAWETTTAQMELIWEEMIGGLIEEGRRWGEDLQNALSILQAQMADVIATSYEGWTTFFSSLPELASGAFDLMMGYVNTYLESMLGGIQSLIEGFSKWKGLDSSAESKWLRDARQGLLSSANDRFRGADGNLGDAEKKFRDSEDRLAQIRENIHQETERKIGESVKARQDREQAREKRLADLKERLSKAVGAIAERNAAGDYNQEKESLSAVTRALGTFSGRELQGMLSKANDPQERAAAAAEEIVNNTRRANFLLEEAATLA